MEDEDKIEEYDASNLLNYFKKNNMFVNGVFTCEGRVVLIQFFLNGIDMFLYIPSKYFIKPDSSVKNYININLKAEEEEEGNVSSIFVNKGNDSRKSIEGSLNRFIPLFQESIFKLTYVNKDFMSYINRYDTVETFSFSSPYNKVGYYFMTDLENFYKEGTNLERNLIMSETLLYTRIYNTFESELPSLYNLITNVSLDVKKFSGKAANSTFNDRMKRVADVMQKNKREGRNISECLHLMSSVRADNLKNIFYMEKVIQFLKEIKEIS